jgi:hypothetical protein
VSESGSTSGVNGPWLDMSAYPNLPPDDAVDERALDTLRTVLRAPEVTPPPADAWDRAVQEAVTGDPTHEGTEGSGYEDPVHEDPVHEDSAHEPGWPAGHDDGTRGLSGPGGLQDPHDSHDSYDSHDSHDGGGHW